MAIGSLVKKTDIGLFKTWEEGHPQSGRFFRARRGTRLKMETSKETWKKKKSVLNYSC